MNFDDNITEVFDEYLMGRMNEGEKKEFEAQLESDPALKEAFEFHRNIVAGIREARREELKDYIKKNAKIAYIGNVWPRNWVYASAAIIALFFGLYFVLQFYNKNDSTLVHNQTDTNKVTATDTAKPQHADDAENEVAEQKDKTNVAPDAQRPVTRPYENDKVTEDVVKDESAPVQEKNLPVYVLTRPEKYESAEPNNAPAKASFTKGTSISIEYMPGDKLQYRYNNSGLVLYKVPSQSDVWLYMIDSKTYLQYNKAYYNLLKNDKVNDLTPLKDSSVPKELPPVK